MAEDIVARAKTLLSVDLRYAPNRDVKLLIEELVDELVDERRDCRILEAIIHEHRETEQWKTGR
jgi:hypothetical protein